MAFYKIFPENLSKRTSENLHVAPLRYSKFLIGFACSRNEGFNVITVQMRFLKTEPWQIVKSNMPSQGGQAVTELGSFDPSTVISVFWVVRAVTKINSISVYIINDSTKEIRKIAPNVPPKKMERGEDWGEEVIDLVLF